MTDITFCDLCNESVPQADVELGWAVRRSGRLICMRCDAAMTSGSPGPGGGGGIAERAAGGPAAASAVGVAGAIGTTGTPGEPLPGRARGGAPANGTTPGTGGPAAGPAGTPTAEGQTVRVRGGSGVGWVALVFGSGAIAFLVHWGRGFEASVGERFGGVAERARSAERRAERRSAKLGEDIAASEERLTLALAESLAPVNETLAELRDGLERQSRRWDELRQDMELARADADARHQATELTFERQAAQLKRIDEDLRFYKNKIIELEEGVRGIAQAGVPISLLPGGAATTPEGGTPRWTGLLPDLDHASAAIRLEAVYALGDTKDPLVVPHLLPRLSDSDMFVRLATARILLALEAKAAVPDLIDALEDREIAVRDAAATALRTITGRNFRYDPRADEDDRAARIREWRSWWDRSSKSFLEG